MPHPCSGMLQDYFKFLFRSAEREPAQAGGPQRGLRMDEAYPDSGRPTAEFLAHKNVESRRGPAMHQPPYEPPSKPVPQDAEPLEEKVVRLTPRPRSKAEAPPTPPHDDDNDPGPAAA